MTLHWMAVTHDSDDDRIAVRIDYFSIQIDDTLLALADMATMQSIARTSSARTLEKQLRIARELRGEFGLQKELPGKAAWKRKVNDGQ